MSRTKELKIRDALKSVYSLYAKVDDFLFTTFNYEPDFFAEHIVAYLMGFDRKITTIGELQEADEWVRKNNVSVYYDKNALSPGNSCMSVPVFPQNNKTGGVFHPKVIVIYGKLKEGRHKESVHLFVSSCNLTVSGYGRNIEAFSCIQVTSKKVAESLSRFIQSLKSDDTNRHSELIRYLDSITSKDDSVEFLWTNENQGVRLLDVLADFPRGNLSVCSPYFDENGPKALLEKLNNTNKIIVIPSLDHETYNIHLKDYLELKNKHNVSFAVLKNEDALHFIHAKIIYFGGNLIVGSYNFTTAALCGINSEAALLFRGKQDFRLDLLDADENRFLKDAESVSNKDEIENDEKNIFVSVTIKWKEFKIYIHAEDLNENSQYSLSFDGLSEGDLHSQLKDGICIPISQELKKHLLCHKIFTVFKDGIVCFKGLINELDVEDRPEFECESLNEAIKEWFNYSEDSYKNDKRSLRLIDSDEEETEKILGINLRDSNDIFDNYYLVSKSFENLISEITKCGEDSKAKCSKAQRKTEKYWNRYTEWKNKKNIADKKLYGFLVTKPGNIENMVSFLQNDHFEKSSKDIVYEWLVVNYIKNAISFLPKNLIHNDLNRTYKDKISTIMDDIRKIERDIKREIKTEVDFKYLQWIEEEFYKREKSCLKR